MTRDILETSQRQNRQPREMWVLDLQGKQALGGEETFRRQICLRQIGDLPVPKPSVPMGSRTHLPSPPECLRQPPSAHRRWMVLRGVLT